MTDDEAAFSEIARRFSGGDGRDGLEDFDLGALAALGEVERRDIAQVMRQRVESGVNDPRIVRALVALRMPGIDALLARLMERADDTGVAAAAARWGRTGSTDVIGPLTRVMTNPSSGAARLSAALLLGEIDDEQCRVALGDALDSDDGELRNVATTAFLRTVGLAELERRGRSPISRLGALILNPLAAVRGPAAAELRGIIAAARAGATAESLGLMPDGEAESAFLSAFRTSVFARPQEPGPWRKSLDLNAFRGLVGEERERGVQFILMLLGERDRRAISAIVELQLRVALPAVAEAASSGPTAFRRLAQEAVAQMDVTSAVRVDP